MSDQHIWGKAAAPARLGFCLLLCTVLLSLPACTSRKASQESPELPARHWLDESPGVPMEKRDKIESAVPNLYDTEKVFSFDDCVYLAIQQSPMLVNSAVDVETKKLQRTDAVWQYLPEPRMTMTVSSNLTRYNSNEKDIPTDYGRTKMTIGFHAHFPNPVVTYFNHQVQKLMVELAISTHRKAIADVIRQIADIYLRLDAQRRILELQESLLPMGREQISYWQQVEAVDGQQGIMVDMARQQERQMQLQREKLSMEETMLRTRLKILAGIDPQQQLKLDVQDASAILRDFDGRAIAWEDRWAVSEDELLVRTQVRLHDYNIMVAWAQYIPDMTIRLNNAPPSGQYQPARGTEDTFVHLDFDFPLLDWGRRYRNVQVARMDKAKAFHEQARMRTDFSNKWLQAEQRVRLAETSLKIAENRLETSRMDYKETEIAFREGLGDFPQFLLKRENVVNDNIQVIEAELELELAKLEWMYLAGMLQERYLGLPAKEIGKE